MKTLQQAAAGAGVTQVPMPDQTRSNAAAGHYRPDIDGLRALAILPVVFYHYRVAGFSGGFVGVDVFFVISGFLITSLIHGEMQAGRFSIAQFYERRVRRIFPALFALLLAATVAAYFILFPTDFARYARTLMATAAFGSNFEFWKEAGYFDAAADQKPLLHLWSIAVEEQFYLIFPLVLWACAKISHLRLRLVLGGILIASFALSVWGVANAQAATFYLLPTRAWELMVGALLAVGALPDIRMHWLREALALAGLALLAFAVFGFTPQTPFPGAAALAPCVGAALLIYSGKGGSRVGDVLSLRPLVFIGLISYSLYLVHWPLFVFTRYVVYRPLHPVEICALLAISFALATLSWRFIERPFRAGRFTISKRALFGGAVALMAGTAACAAVVFVSNGLPQRLNPRVRMILAEEQDHEPRIQRCFGLTAKDVEAGKLCRIGSNAAQAPTFLLWGDSHADAFLPAVSNVADRQGRKGLFAGTDSCAPLLGVARSDAGKCKKFNDAVIKLALSPSIREVILDARWAKSAEGTSYGDEPKGHVVMRDADGQASTQAATNRMFLRGLSRTVSTLRKAGKKVILVGSVPEIGYPVPAVMARRSLAGKHSPLVQALSVYMARQHFVFYAFDEMQRDYGAKIIYPHKVLCETGSCRVAVNGKPLYRDEHHLSVFGAMQLTPILAGVF
ncbi:MAG TPA: acyltransferase family protein [Rhizomicrobium sp.]|nr:acyltransferase family protein [Rhizomicrobium sp.]